MHYPYPIFTGVGKKTNGIIGVSQSRIITPDTIASDLSSPISGQAALNLSKSPSSYINLNWLMLFSLVDCYMYVLLPKSFPPFPEYYYWEQIIGSNTVRVPLDGDGYETVITFTKTDDFEYPNDGKKHILYISNGIDNEGGTTWPINCSFITSNDS